jgi:hypothetical protein
MPITFRLKSVEVPIRKKSCGKEPIFFWEKKEPEDWIEFVALPPAAL